MTIGIDADGVLFDYVGACAKFLNKFTGMDIASYSTASNFDVLKAWKVPGYYQGIVDEHFSKPFSVYDMPVIDGAREFISAVRILTKNDFVIITSCPCQWHTEREAALENHFGIDRKNIHFSHDKKLFKIDILIDDWHQNLDGFDGWRILVDRPWNQDTEGIACSRTFGYNDTLQEIDRVLNWNR